MKKLCQFFQQNCKLQHTAIPVFMIDSDLLGTVFLVLCNRAALTKYVLPPRSGTLSALPFLFVPSLFLLLPLPFLPDGLASAVRGWTIGIELTVSRANFLSPNPTPLSAPPRVHAPRRRMLFSTLLSSPSHSVGQIIVGWNWRHSRGLGGIPDLTYCQQICNFDAALNSGCDKEGTAETVRFVPSSS